MGGYPGQVVRAPRATILVVIDDPARRERVRSALADGFRVVEAQGESAALTALDHEGIDLVLLGPGPSGDGRELCRQIRQAPRDPALPIFWLGGGAADGAAWREVGADDEVSELATEELLHRVDRATTVRRQAIELREQLAERHELEQRQSDLLALLVHDLRTPLSGVLGFVGSAREGLTGHPALEDLDLAMTSAGKLRDTLDDVLRVCQIERGSTEPHPQLVSAFELIHEVVTPARRVGKSRGVSIAVDAPLEHTLHVDKKLVQRALDNVVALSVRYAPRDGLVEVIVRPTDSGTEIIVMDRGVGITGEQKELLFDPYGAVRAGQRLPRVGIGMGPHLAKLVAKLHGGSLTCHDRPDGGIILRLWLPSQAPAEPGD
jgi:signal transduction histidine kinase